MTEHSEVYVRASAANESRLLQSPGQLHDFLRVKVERFRACESLGLRNQ